MDSSTQTMADDAKSMNDLFELVEKLTIQLNEKDKELATKEQQNMELTASLNSVKARANQADALNTALVTSESEKREYQQTIQSYQTQFWKYFPSPHPCYYIKAPSGLAGVQQKYHYFYANSSWGLSSSGDQPLPCAGHFKFTKNLDGSFFIYSMAKEKYLRTESSSSPHHVYFDGDDDNNAVKFVLYFYKQNQQPGIMVDIRSLANDCFLAVDNQNYVAVNSRTAPRNKFLIIPADKQ